VSNVVSIGALARREPNIPGAYRDQAKQALATVDHVALGLTPDGYRPFAHAFNVDEIATAIMFLQLGPISGKHGSYTLKHYAENWGKLLGFSAYIPNGALILAALYLRLKVKPYGGRNPNAEITIPKNTGNDLL
jgi:hypothetical protein